MTAYIDDGEDVFGEMPADDGSRWPAYAAALVIGLLMLGSLLA